MRRACHGNDLDRYLMPKPSQGRACEMAHTVLITTIITMVLVSLPPFATKKIVLFATAILCLSSVACFADSLFMTRRFAPAEQVNSTSAPQRAQTTVRPAGLPAPSAAANRENFPTKFDPRSLEMDDFVITPIVNQPGQSPAWVRRRQPVYVVWPI